MKPVAILLVVCATTLLFFAIPTRAQTANGKIEGQIANGTKDAKAASVQNLTVRLFGIDPSATHPFSTTTLSDGSGKFTFSNLATNPATKYLLTTQYAGVDYFSDALAFEANKNQLTATITIYETTTDLSVLGVAQTHLIFDVRTRVFNVAQIIIVQNSSDRALVAGSNRATLLLPILPGARNVQFDRSDADQTTLRGDGVMTYTLPFVPGGEQIVYTYALPFLPPSYQFNLKIPFDSARVRVLLTDVGGTIQSAQLSTPSSFRAQGGQKYLLSTAENIRAGTVLNATLTNLPASVDDRSRPSNQLEPLVAGIVLGLSALLCTALLVYPMVRRRGANA